MKDLAFLQLEKIKQEVQSPSPYTHTHPTCFSDVTSVMFRRTADLVAKRRKCSWSVTSSGHKKSMTGGGFKAASFIRQAVVAFMPEVSFPAILTRRPSLWFSHGGQRSRYPSQPAGSLFRPYQITVVILYRIPSPLPETTNSSPLDLTPDTSHSNSNNTQS